MRACIFLSVSAKTATGSSCRSGIAAVGQTLCQTPYALNLISAFAKSTVPGAHISTAFSQEYSANEVVSVTLAQS